MNARAFKAASRRISRSSVWKIAAVALFLFVTCEPAVLARNDSPIDFWLQQKEPETQANPPRSGPPPRARKPVRDFVPTEATRAPGSVGGTPVQPTFFINVLGDSLASESADGLTQAFADRPEIAIIGRGRDSSGLVRDDFYDWPKAASDLAAAKDKLDFVVVVIGSNDQQTLKDGAESLDQFSDKWREAYGQRVERMVAPFKLAHVPVAWVGLPPMRNERYNAQAVKLNEVYKERAEKAGAQYIDIWDAFADEDGQYSAYGPDLNGQNAKLRAADGIHLTKAGSRKLAHFLEAEIKRAFDAGRPQQDLANLPPDIEQQADDINAQIRREMGVASLGGAATQAEPAKPLAGPIFQLTARPLSQGGGLVTRQTARQEGGAAERLLSQGAAIDPKPGRADDFAWPPL